MYIYIYIYVVLIVMIIIVIIIIMISKGETDFRDPLCAQHLHAYTFSAKQRIDAFITQISYLSKSKPEHTTGGSERVGARQYGGLAIILIILIVMIIIVTIIK